jgi:EthD domain
MTKLFVFVRALPGLEPETFWREWGLAVDELLSTDPGRMARRALENRAVTGAGPPPLPLSPFDGAYELWFDDLAGVEAVLADRRCRDCLETRAAAVTEPDSTLVLAATEAVQFDRGFGEIKFMGLSRRAATFASRDEWIRYWVEVHGPLAHDIPEFTRYYGRYVHNYVMACAGATGGLEPPFDGIVEECIESVDAFARCLSEPRYLETVRPDERRFVDFERSHMLLVRENALLER